jgi:AraC-like DNA-binding protein
MRRDQRRGAAPEATAYLGTRQVHRLTNAEFLSPFASMCMYRQRLDEPVALHWHEFYEIHLVLAGEGIHVLNGVPYPMARGYFVLLTPADFHEVIPRPGTSINLFNLMFSDDMLSDELCGLLFSNSTPYSTVFAGDDLAALEAEFRRIWAETTERLPGYRLLIQGALDRILVDAARANRAGIPVRAGDGPADRRQLSNTLIYIQHHFREPLSLAQVAAHAHLSPSYFSDHFHRAIGVPFQSHLQDVRLRFARSLLAVSDMPVTAVCTASGFANLSHFGRAFRRKYGLPPRAFRKTRPGLPATCRDVPAAQDEPA